MCYLEMFNLLANADVAELVDKGDKMAKTAATIFLVVCVIFFILFVVTILIPMWIVFSKAGKPGWAAFIPIYSGFVLAEIVGRPVLWAVLLLVPIVNIFVGIIMLIDLCKSFGKGAGHAVGMIILPFLFYPLLAFTGRYEGPAAA